MEAVSGVATTALAHQFISHNIISTYHPRNIKILNLLFCDIIILFTIVHIILVHFSKARYKENRQFY
jgi:hypothetical protein